MDIIYPNHKREEVYTAAIGFFDGVHLGHRFVIDELRSTAACNNQQSLVITFGIHPRKVLHADFQPELLTTLPEKLALLAHAGVDACAVLDFNRQMAEMPACSFMQDVLKKQLNVGTLLVGYDHRFGHNRTEAFPDYAAYGKKLGINVVQIKSFSTNRYEHISSSEIRKALQAGDIESANSMLGYKYAFKGKVVDGFKVGRKIGFPTANLLLDNEDKLLPASGVYAVYVHIHNEEYKGMLNIGRRPTLNNGEHTSIEVHIMDFDKDIYNQTIEIEFIGKTRNEKKFNHIDKLIAQLKKDKEEVQKLIAKSTKKH